MSRMKDNIVRGVRKALPSGMTRLLEEGYRKTRVHAVSARYGYPARDLKVIAITGTNGKTTTAYLVESALRAAGRADENAQLGTLIGPAVPYAEVADVIEDIVEAYLALRDRPEELFVDTVKRLGVEPIRERVYATR